MREEDVNEASNNLWQTFKHSGTSVPFVTVISVKISPPREIKGKRREGSSDESYHSFATFKRPPDKYGTSNLLSYKCTLIHFPSS